MSASKEIKKLLIDLDLTREEWIYVKHPSVRDNPNIEVLACERSGIIFLSGLGSIDIKHYERKPCGPRKEHVQFTLRDNQRRFDMLFELMVGKRWLDIGSGAGGILDLLSEQCLEVVSIEPQEARREQLLEVGYQCFPQISSVADEYFDVITLFHVVEHFTTPIRSLVEVYSKLKKDGIIIIEIPHARDFLLSFLDLDAFKDFTFWSEHLILHTRESITVFLKKAGFKDISIKGIQRYPLSNHLYWLSKQKPGGHKYWAHLNDPNLHLEYSDLLQNLDMSDTLWISARK